MSKAKKRRSPLKTVLLAVLGLLIVLLLALLIIPLTETGDETAVEGSADWMARLPDGLKLNEIILPGTHDSATQNVQLAFITKCQSKSIGEQLEAGYRYLDIRLGEDGDRLKLMHGFTNCKTGALPWSDTLYLDTVLEQCYAFLKAHPTETVVFAVKQEHGDLSVAEFEALLNAYIEKNPEYWLCTDTIPALEDARGRLVLMRRYDDEAQLGKASGIPLLWEDQGGSGDVTESAAENDCVSYTLWVQDRYEYGAEDKWNAFEAGMLLPEENSVVISFLTTKGTLPVGHPYSFAKELNPLLMEKEELSGWIIVDFASAPMAQHIYEMNFGE